MDIGTEPTKSDPSHVHKQMVCSTPDSANLIWYTKVIYNLMEENHIIHSEHVFKWEDVSLSTFEYVDVL